MLSKKQIKSYGDNGYLAVENVLTPEEVERLRRVTDAFVEQSRTVVENDDVFDLEPTHTIESPRLRRLNSPYKQHPVYKESMHHPTILEIVSQLIGYELRVNGHKLNIKHANYGSPVEWHQDWAFYPHTNDDLLAVGIAIDPMTAENGGLLVIPGSHKGIVYNHHHSDGYFVGAVTDGEFSPKNAVPVTVGLGGISIHHVRTLHGSEPNKSPEPRRLLLTQYCAIDAWPLCGIADWESFNADIVRGEPTKRPRVTNVPVIMPYPEGDLTGSIYEVQRMMEARLYEVK